MALGSYRLKVRLRVSLCFCLFSCRAGVGDEAGSNDVGNRVAPEEEVYGQLIAAGAIEGFEATETDMPVGDMQCLLTGLDGGDGAVFAAARNFFRMLEPMVFKAGSTASVDRPKLAQVEGGMQALLELEAAVASGCLHDRVLRSLRHTSDALLSLTMQNGRFTAGKADVHDDLVLACRHFKAVDYRSCGRDLGRVWRTVFNTGEGSDFMDPDEVQDGQAPTSLDAILEVTSSLLSSFFTNGDSSGSWEQPHFRLCVQQQHSELEDLWTNVGSIFTRASPEDGTTWRFSSGNEATAHREAQQLAALADMLELLPSILGSCSLHDVSQILLQKSLEVLRQPPEQLQNSAVAALVVIGKHWTASAWQDTGSRLGLLMQDLLLHAFPQQFHFDRSGRLQSGAPVVHQPGATELRQLRSILLCLFAVLVVPIAGFLCAKTGSLSRLWRMTTLRPGQEAKSDRIWAAETADKFLDTRTLEGANLLTDTVE